MAPISSQRGKLNHSGGAYGSLRGWFAPAFALFSAQKVFPLRACAPVTRDSFARTPRDCQFCKSGIYVNELKERVRVFQVSMRR